MKWFSKNENWHILIKANTISVGTKWFGFDLDMYRFKKSDEPVEGFSPRPPGEVIQLHPRFRRTLPAPAREVRRVYER